MILPTSTQIIETQPSQETPELFVPRQQAPSWSPPRVTELPPAKPKAYDDQSDEFLAEPVTLQMVRHANKDDSKHCKTCACNLLP